MHATPDPQTQKLMTFEDPLVRSGFARLGLFPVMKLYTQPNLKDGNPPRFLRIFLYFNFGACHRSVLLPRFLYFPVVTLMAS